ncbi:hypothetical protein [Streptomyces nanshensis]|uniref:Uncharacterized protein n=1 Tax=Streptomyces nanshensis TaxID=518642 RepID=A0A1E7LA18_9ACTN|nr:hypothetical protein [Streptomyces nanshensis]OEV12998.1 hypothetical protein AN218_05675 [Streptomyces nanshensis]
MNNLTIIVACVIGAAGGLFALGMMALDRGAAGTTGAYIALSVFLTQVSGIMGLQVAAEHAPPRAGDFQQAAVMYLPYLQLLVGVWAVITAIRCYRARRATGKPSA